MILLQQKIDNLVVELNINMPMTVSTGGYLTTKECGRKISQIPNFMHRNKYTTKERDIMFNHICDYITNNVDKIQEYILLSNKFNSIELDESMKSSDFKLLKHDYQISFNRYYSTTDEAVYTEVIDYNIHYDGYSIGYFRYKYDYSFNEDSELLTKHLDKVIIEHANSIDLITNLPKLLSHVESILDKETLLSTKKHYYKNKLNNIFKEKDRC
jgi:hypothetical protein